MENSNQTNSKIAIPNSSAVLVLGIISIPFGICPYFLFIIGFILGIIALVLSKSSNDAYLKNPNDYSTNSYSNLKAGRVCATIGLCLASCWLLFLIFFVFSVIEYGTTFIPGY